MPRPGYESSTHLRIQTIQERKLVGNRWDTNDTKRLFLHTTSNLRLTAVVHTWIFQTDKTVALNAFQITSKSIFR